jgi:hypothetical protein
MKCLSVNDQMDVCVTVSVKVIFMKSASGELEEELARKDTRLRAEYLGRTHEEAIARKLREDLLNEQAVC